MFEVERMTKTRLLCAKSDLEAVTDALYEFGAIHVTRAKTENLFTTGTPLAKLERVSPALIKLRGVEDSLKKIQENKKNKEKKEAKPKQTAQEEKNFAGASLDELEREYAALRLDEFDALVKEKQETEAEFAVARARARELDAFKELRFNPNELEAVSPGRVVTITFFEIAAGAGSGGEAQVTAKIKARGEARVFHSVKGKTFVAAVVPRGELEALRNELGRSVREIAAPQLPSNARATFASESEAATERFALAQEKLSTAQGKLASFAAERGTRVTELRIAFETEFRKADVGALFGQTELAAAVEGWIPKHDLECLQNVLERKFAGRVLLEEIDSKNDVPPSKLNNPRLAKPFETLTQFFSLPRYNEIDPTLLTAVTYPLFFGMILGDVAYGAIIALLGIAIWFKTRGFLRNLGGVMATSGFSAILFGFVFGEFAGGEEMFGVALHPLISRVEETGINTLIGLVILVGFIHLTLGLVLGALEAWKEAKACAEENDLKHAALARKHALAKASWLVILIGMAAFITNAMPELAFVKMLSFLHALTPPLDLVVFVAGILGLIVSEGVIAVFEIPGLLSNLLSYLRIMALGLSGVALAGMIAKIGVDFGALASFNAGAMANALLLLVIVVLGHALAVALGMMEGGIQSLRLHYVEFYSKFYKGGGVPFKAFRE